MKENRIIVYVHIYIRAYIYIFDGYWHIYKKVHAIHKYVPMAALHQDFVCFLKKETIYRKSSPMVSIRCNFILESSNNLVANSWSSHNVHLTNGLEILEENTCICLSMKTELNIFSIALDCLVCEQLFPTNIIIK